MNKKIAILEKRLVGARGGHKKVIEAKLAKLARQSAAVEEVKASKPKKKAAKKKTTKKKA